MKREYFDIDLKDQRKRVMEILRLGLQRFEGIIHDQYEDRYFSGRQSWRNPLLMRVSLPEGKRWEFISFTRIWLARPSRIQMEIRQEPRPIPLRGKHEGCLLRRSYRLADPAWIKNFSSDGKTYDIYHGDNAVMDVLSGNLDTVIRV